MYFRVKLVIAGLYDSELRVLDVLGHMKHPLNQELSDLVHPSLPISKDEV